MRKTFAIIAFCLIPLMLIGFAVGFVAEIFLVGYRAGQGIIKEIKAASMAQHMEKS